MTQSKIVAICSALQHIQNVAIGDSNQRGRDISANLFGLWERGLFLSLELEIEKLPENARNAILQACDGDLGFQANKPKATIALTGSRPTKVMLRAS